MFKCLLILWAPLLTLICARFSCLGVYHDGGTISGSDPSVDEGIGKWLSAYVCFRLAGTIDEGDTFSDEGNAFSDEDGAFSLSGSRFLSIETLVSSLEMDA